MTLSRHPSQSSIVPGRSSWLLPVTHTKLMYVNICWSAALVCLCVGVNKRTSLKSSSLLLQQCTGCLVHLTCMVCEMGGELSSVSDKSLLRRLRIFSGYLMIFPFYNANLKQKMASVCLLVRRIYSLFVMFAQFGIVSAYYKYFSVSYETKSAVI